MIKKLLLTGMLTACIAIHGLFSQAASCTPDFSCLPGGATEGICPDSATGIPPANLGSAYNTSVSIKIPGTFDLGGTPYTLSHFVLTEVTIDTNASGTYYPLSVIGLDYLGNGSNSPGVTPPAGVTMTKYCYWNAPGNACAVVSGIPTKSGTFPLRIKSMARAVIFGVGTWQPAPDNDQYKMVVNPPLGVETSDALRFSVEQNTPNPFVDKSVIRFSSQEPGSVEFKVYNMLGSVIYSNVIKAEKGMNSIRVDANTFAPGAYMYSIRNGNKTITKRMIVSK